VRIAHFLDPALEQEFLDLIDGVDASAVKGIVIDLRYTLGGQSAIAEKMISSLIDQPVSAAIWKYPHHIAAYRSWGREPVWSEESHLIPPRDGKRYPGPLVLLTGGITYSTAEDFVLSLHYSGRAVLVGGKTAGSSGNPIQVPLPGGGVFEVATFKAFYPDGREYVGIGIQPDVEIYPTREDIRSGTDPVLEKGIEVIRNWEAYRP
jgi:carboxyl-terminal processing protease